MTTDATDATAGAPPPASHRDLLTGPRFAHLATRYRDGSLSSSVVWFEHDPAAGVLRITTEGTRRKARSIDGDPHVALSILDPDDPYRTLEVRGVATVEPDPTGAVYDRLAAVHGFTREPADRSRRVALVVRPTRWVPYGRGASTAGPTPPPADAAPADRGERHA